MKDETRNRLLKSAKNYEDYELDLFIAETGWEDWMNDYLDEDIDDDEYISDETCERIDKILIEIFNEAHEENA